MVEFREETDSVLKFYYQCSSLSCKVVIIILLILKDSFMKHSLKLKSCVFTFRSFMVIAVSLWVVIPLKGFAQAKKSELTREVDFSSQVKWFLRNAIIGVIMHVWKLLRITYSAFIVLTIYAIIL